MDTPVALHVAGRHAPVVDAEPGEDLALAWSVSTGHQGAHRLVLVDESTGTSVWDSGRVPGALARAVVPGRSLAPLTRLVARVRAWGPDDPEPSDWSAPLSLTTGPGPVWPVAAAVWAGPDASGREPDWAWLRGTATLPPGVDIAHAVVHATATDPEPARQYVYRLWLDDQPIGVGPVRSVAAEHRCDGVDVTAELRAGARRLDALCYTTAGHRFQALLVVWTGGGERLLYGTGPDWQARSAPGRRRLGELGTLHFAAPQEDVGDHGPVVWAPAAVHPGLTGLRPAPQDKITITPVVPAAVTEVADPANPGRATYRLDFGATVVGGLLAPPGASGPVTVRSAELRDAQGRARFELSTTNTYLDRFAAGPGPGPGSGGTPTWGLRVFRHVDVGPLPSGLGPTDLRAEQQLYPLPPTSTLTTTDPVLQQVWDFCAQTLRATNHHLFVDSWTREREPYEADAYLQLRADLALAGELGVARYSLQYLLRRRTWPTEWPLFMIFAVHDHVLHTGDLSLAAESLDALVALGPQHWRDQGWLDPTTGLITKPDGSDGSASRTDCDIVDWPPAERDGYVFGPVNTVINAFAHRALADLAELCRWCDDPRADAFVDAATGLRAAINTHLFDPTLGAYRDGLDTAGRPIHHHATHASAFCAAFDVVPAEHRDRVGAWLARRGMACSVYAAAFLVEGLFRLGRPTDAYRLLTATGPRSWAGMIALGAGATGEAWSEQDKPNLTWSHPWGTSPTYLIVEHLLGIRPLQPGFGRFAVRPADVAVGDALQATVQTAVGPIAVRWQRTAQGRELELGVPGNAIAVVTLGDDRLGDETVREVGPGRWRLVADEADGTVMTQSLP